MQTTIFMSQIRETAASKFKFRNLAAYAKRYNAIISKFIHFVQFPISCYRFCIPTIEENVSLVRCRLMSCSSPKINLRLDQRLTLSVTKIGVRDMADRMSRN